MKRFAIFDQATGVISCMFFGEPETALANTPEGSGFIVANDDVSDATHLVNVWGSPYTVLAKTEVEIGVDKTIFVADGIDFVTFTVPVGTTVEIAGITDVIEDGIFEFAVDLPGTYTARFSYTNYLSKEVSIEGIPAT